MMMKQIRQWMLAAILLCGSTTMMAQTGAKYCMTYDDYMDNRWIPLDSLVEGRTEQMCQMKFESDQYKFKTGDKEADGILKKAVLCVQYGGHMYVNCRNLRCNDVVLDVRNYAQAYHYEGKKILVVAHWINTGAVLASLAGDVVAIASPLPVAIPAAVGSTALWISIDKLSNYRCYLLDSEADTKGRYAVTRIDDEQMEKILAGDAKLLARYKAIEKKRERQSASNILPILMEKNLVKE